MENKPGYKTSEFWVMAVVNVTAAVIAILGARGLLDPTEGELWVDLVEALAVAIAPIVMSIVSSTYIESRTSVKVAERYAQLNNDN